jgi:hypothetical protein
LEKGEKKYSSLNFTSFCTRQRGTNSGVKAEKSPSGVRQKLGARIEKHLKLNLCGRMANLICADAFCWRGQFGPIFWQFTTRAI